MIKHSLKKLPQNTFEILIDIPWEEIEKEYKGAFDLILAEFSFEGFRKGKVPASIAEKHIPKDQVYSQLIRTLIPRVYEEIVKKENLKPIVSPKVDLIQAKEKETWQIKATLAEKPEVVLGEYKKKIQEAKASLKTDDIWVPGKEQKQEDVNAKNDKLLSSALSVVLKEVKCEVPPMLIESEMNRKLTALIDDVQKIGLTVENYLTSKGLTMDKLKEQYTKEITDMYRLEFILHAIADSEKISVEQADLDKLFGNLKDEKERATAQANSYFYASVMRKQKTLDYLMAL
jgi:FKBP-type peptidyl-prolyl cis-trans isomerase (trigger factor)